MISENASDYYTSNRNIIEKNQFNSIFVGTDKVIYSPNVMVLKDIVEYKPFFNSGEKGIYRNSPYYVDVLTCAAPFFSGLGYIIPNGDLEHLFKRRIRNIFEVAIENGIDVMILGAFGCGAFHNPPDVVANAFRSVLLEKRYINAFDKVIFAVKRTGTICSNIEAFEYNFSNFPNVNENGEEKKHRLSWKWECTCGMRNAWDSLYCERCESSRNNRKYIIQM